MSGRVCGRDAIVACIAFRYGVRQEPTRRRSAKRRHRWTVFRDSRCHDERIAPRAFRDEAQLMRSRCHEE